MKAFLALALCACVLALVHGETCSHTSDCVNTACTSGAFVACSHHANQCTCYTHNTHGISCTSRDTCRASSYLHCDRDNRHCVDGYCHCTHGD